jgi:hypothetical protein
MREVSPDGVAHSRAGVRAPGSLRAGTGEAELIGAGGGDDCVELGMHCAFQSFADNVNLRMD